MRDGRAANIAALGALTIIAQQIAGKATRDTLFLTSFDATELPQVMLAAAGLALGGVVVLSRLLAAYGPARIVPGLFLVSAALFAVEAAVQQVEPELVAYAVYLHIAFFGAAVISGFWSVVNERFDPHAAKRWIGRIAMGATAGGVVGGLAAERVASTFGPGRLLVLLSGLNVVAAVLIATVSGGSRVTPSTRASGLSALRSSSFLRRIAGVVVLLAVGGALLDFALKAQADGVLTEGEDLASFFALYYTAVGVATFVLQTLATRRGLERLGIGVMIAMMPMAVILLGSISAAFTRLWSLVALRGVSTVLENSVYRSGYELLYTPVPPAKKRPAKLLIDVAGNRLGDALASGFVLLLLLLLTTENAIRVSVALAVIAAVGALILVARLQRGYVSQLAASLRTGALFLDEELAADATTRRALAETTMALDREKLLKAIDEHRRDRAALGDDLEASSDLGQGVNARDVADLVPQLAQASTRRMAARVLRRATGRHLGQMVDALLNSEIDLAARRFLPPIIASAANPRAVHGLMAALEDPRFEVRYRCGVALSALCARDPSLAPSDAEVFTAAAREVRVGKKVWESQQLLQDLPDDDESGFAAILRERRDRSLEHVFNILSLALDRDTLRISLSALINAESEELRGTALEYLENVLPDELRQGLWPYIGSRKRDRPSQRPPREVVDELLRSMDSLQIDREALLKRIEEEDERREASVPPDE
ncbi:MAG: hypothetical protein AAGE52_11765 [Myxococcota bacterium]